MGGSRKIHTHPMEGDWKFLGGGWVLKAKFLEKMYENNLELPGGRGGAKQKTFCGGNMDIFWNCTMSDLEVRPIYLTHEYRHVSMS